MPVFPPQWPPVQETPSREATGGPGLSAGGAKTEEVATTPQGAGRPQRGRTRRNRKKSNQGDRTRGWTVRNPGNGAPKKQNIR